VSFWTYVRRTPSAWIALAAITNGLVGATLAVLVLAGVFA